MTQGRPTEPGDPGAAVHRPDASPAPGAQPPATGAATTPDARPRAEDPGRAGRSDRRPEKDPLRGSKAGGFWFATVALGLVLVLLVVFIVQNTQSVQVQFFALDAEAPLAASLMIAAAAGILLAAIGGTLRIWQLRRRVKRTR